MTELAASILSLLLCLAGTGHGDTDRWYEIEIAGMTCGYLHEHVESSGDRVRSRSEERFAVSRDGLRVEVAQTVLFEQDLRGVPIRSEVLVKSGGEEQPVVYDFTPDGILRTTTRHGRTRTESIILGGEDWLTPMDASKFIATRIAAGASTLNYRTVEPADDMRLVEIHSELIGNASFEHRGRSIPVSRWRTRTSGSPIELIELRARDGTVVSSEAELGIGPMRLRLVDRERALRALEQPAPELLGSTVVPVSGMPSRSERTQRASYRVRVQVLKDFSLPESGAQRVTSEPDGALRVEIDATRGSPASEKESLDPTYLASSGLIDFKDPEVLRFSERSLRGASDDRLERAAILRLAVARHMSRKNFETAFASASDAVRSREGDCTEHAVLLAAALRADGIPARVATGLVHCPIPGTSQTGFAWHMWVQALVSGRWLDLDPTRTLDFDAGHLLVSTSALQRGGGQEQLSGILPLLGRLEIEVLEIDGRSPKEGQR